MLTHAFIISYTFFRLKNPKTNETTNTKITAPSTDGTIAIPAICGPQEPKIAWPSVEPTSPAKIFARKPIEPPLSVMTPASSPIIAPTIKTQIQYIIGSPCF